MEMVNVAIPRKLKNDMDSYIEMNGTSWVELLENIVKSGKVSSALDNALTEAYASGISEKTYNSMAEIWAEIDAEEDELEDV